MVDKDMRWDWDVTVELCSQPWMPCMLTIRGARKCQDYTNELAHVIDSCDYAQNGQCSEPAGAFSSTAPFFCNPGTDSTDCGRNPSERFCHGVAGCTWAPPPCKYDASCGICPARGVFSGTAPSSLGNETSNTAAASTLFRSSSGEIGCHAASGCRGLKVSDLALHCRPDAEAPGGPFQVSGNVEMTIEGSRFSDCRSIQDSGLLSIYNNATVNMEDSIVQ